MKTTPMFTQKKSFAAGNEKFKTRSTTLFSVVSIIAISALVSLCTVPALAQNQDPIIGTWNFHGADLDGSYPFIFVQNFNAGGTTVEFDTAGTNSSGAESIVLGKWSKSESNKYAFKEQNYVYDQSGSLSFIAIASCKLELSSNMKNASGTCTLKFFQCSLTQCPGALYAGPVAYKVGGKRF